MRIEQDLKLGFKDVLFRPKRSTLKSRSQVELKRSFIFKNSQVKWEGVPVIAANMDSVGTFEMAKVLSQHQVLTAIHKHYTVDEWKSFIKSNPETLNNVLVSTGTSESDFVKTQQIMSLSEKLQFICIDIANGYSEHLVEFVSKMRETFPNKAIIAGNVVTGDMVEELILAG